MRKKFIAANWKMHFGIEDSLKYFASFKRQAIAYQNVDVVICPPATSLYSSSVALSESDIQLGAQNCHHEKSGAFTGEISADFLEELGCKYVIVGHSERRQHFKETNETLALKLNRVFDAGLTPIFCVGETWDERKKNQTEAVIEKQLKEGVQSLTYEQISRVVIAYEPVWAIGTGNTATPEQAQDVHAFIRRLVGQIIGHNASLEARVIYGGSVKADNARDLLNKPDIDGALVGSASLNPDDFIEIIRQALS